MEFYDPDVQPSNGEESGDEGEEDEEVEMLSSVVFDLKVTIIRGY